jgi:hypothetical protein
MGQPNQPKIPIDLLTDEAIDDFIARARKDVERIRMGLPPFDWSTVTRSKKKRRKKEPHHALPSQDHDRTRNRAV